MGADWHPEDIKAAIRKRGMTLHALSRQAGCEASAARKALLRPSPRLQAVIGRLLGVHPMVIWPSRYDETGAPRRRGPVRDQTSTPPKPGTHRQKRSAA